MKHTYIVLGSGIDCDGWFKYRLQRDDGRLVKATKARVCALRRKGQIK